MMVMMGAWIQKQPGFLISLKPTENFANRNKLSCLSLALRVRTNTQHWSSMGATDDAPKRSRLNSRHLEFRARHCHVIIALPWLPPSLLVLQFSPAPVEIVKWFLHFIRLSFARVKFTSISIAYIYDPFVASVFIADFFMQGFLNNNCQSSTPDKLIIA